jgi:hypothetical protein
MRYIRRADQDPITGEYAQVGQPDLMLSSRRNRFRPAAACIQQARQLLPRLHTRGTVCLSLQNSLECIWGRLSLPDQTGWINRLNNDEFK